MSEERLFFAEGFLPWDNVIRYLSSNFFQYSMFFFSNIKWTFIVEKNISFLLKVIRDGQKGGGGYIYLS